MKKAIFAMVILAILFSVLPAPVNAAADSRISPAFVHALQERFPDGKYWNHAPEQPNNPDGWTDQPCTHHGTGVCSYADGACGCNSFDDSIQCAGFAAKLAYLYTGTLVHTWDTVETTDGLKAGDVVRINNDRHSIFVTSIAGGVITFADCNIDSDCMIRWNTTITEEALEKIVTYVKVAPVDPSAPLRPALTCPGFCRLGEELTISWLPLPNADEYQIRISRDSVYLRTQTVMECAFYSFTPQQDGCYTFEVTAKNRWGISEPADCSTVVHSHDCRIGYFTDVSDFMDWSHEGIEFAVVNGLFKGTSETTFSPDATMTRGMIATVMWRMAHSPEPKRENPYCDVADGTWYTDAVRWAYENRIMDGVGSGRFDPDGMLTREQIVTVLYRFMGKPQHTADPDLLRAFADEGYIAPWAKDAMYWAVSNQFLFGIAANGTHYLMPTGGATRAQVATILMRFMQGIAAP